MNIERTERRTEVTSLCWSSVSPALTASWATGEGTRLAVWAPESIFQWLLAKLGGRVATPTLTDIVVGPMTDDNFRPCVVDFGHAPVASLCTSSGHDIWWLYLSPSVSARRPEFIDVLAGGRPVRHVEIDLRSLAPDPRPP